MIMNTAYMGYLLKQSFFLNIPLQAATCYYSAQPRNAQQPQPTLPTLPPLP